MFFDREDDEGNCEYKLSLATAGAERVRNLTTQLLFRLNEGHGRATYRVGVRDDGYKEGLPEAELEASLGTLRHMASQLGATISKCEFTTASTPERRVAEVLLSKANALNTACGLNNDLKEDRKSSERRRKEEESKTRVRVAVIGAEGAGKSTLIGSLATGRFDNGRGLARAAVLKHGHEVEADGQTSDIVELTTKADPSVALLDLAGHEKYLKTTIFGLTARFPSAALLVVDARDAPKLRRMTLEHLGVAVALRLNVLVVLAHADLVAEDKLADAVNTLTRLYERVVKQRRPKIFVVSSVTGRGYDDLARALSALPPAKDNGGRDAEDDNGREAQDDNGGDAEDNGREAEDDDREEGDREEDDDDREEDDYDSSASASASVSASPVSSSQGASSPCPLRRRRSRRSRGKAPTTTTRTSGDLLVRLHDAHRSRRAGTVVGGTVHRGEVVAGDVVVFGPMGDAPTWRRVRVRSIRLEPNDEPAMSCGPGESAAFAIGDDCEDVEVRGRRSGGRCYFEPQNSSRRRASGMVLVSASRPPPPATFVFTAELLVLCAPRRRGLGQNYETVVHAHAVRQSAKIVDVRTDGDLVAGQKAVCTLRFLFFAEFISPGTTVILRDGRTRAVGTVLPDDRRRGGGKSDDKDTTTKKEHSGDPKPATTTKTTTSTTGEVNQETTRPKAVRCHT